MKVLKVLLVALSLSLSTLAITGCETDNPLNPKTEVEEVMTPSDEEGEIALLANTKTIETVGVEQVSDENAVTRYGTVPIGTTARSPFVFTNKEEKILDELAPYSPNQFAEE